MTLETRHNISMVALGAIILTAAALAKPDEQAGARNAGEVAEQPTDSLQADRYASHDDTTGH